jgi:hypothetical protein
MVSAMMSGICEVSALIMVKILSFEDEMGKRAEKISPNCFPLQR